MALGQPTKYTPEMPEKYLALCSEGGSTPEFCLMVNIGKRTFYEWCAQYPEMAKAKEQGKSIAEGWWMAQARKTLLEDKFSQTLNSKSYIFTVSGRFGHTADRSLAKRIAALEEKVDQTPESSKGAYAEEASYTVDDDNKAV